MNTQVTFVLVDDDAINNMLSEILIEDEFPGTKIISFVDPEEAIEFFSTTIPKEENHKLFLFLDVNMPLMTGWDFLERLEQNKVEITDSFYIYMLSSSVNHDDVDKSTKNPNIISFIEKPLNFEFLSQLSTTFSLK
ncbi:MAG: response regulator [Polaribacter sp.]|nr:response regulator [Polaribacter sp.]